MVKLYTVPTFREFVAIDAQDVVNLRMENVVGSIVIMTTRLSNTIREMEEEFLVLIGNVSTLNVVSTTKRISIIQL